MLFYTCISTNKRGARQGQGLLFSQNSAHTRQKFPGVNDHIYYNLTEADKKITKESIGVKNATKKYLFGTK